VTAGNEKTAYDDFLLVQAFSKKTQAKNGKNTVSRPIRSFMSLFQSAVAK
jgi:hypothetical protein